MDDEDGLTLTIKTLRIGSLELNEILHAEVSGAALRLAQYCMIL